ncbi:hypothetical protein PflCFBP13510_13760 [Pseudomonas fluorescens]|nr:hypothetical protein PflCFBP13510_13760 [Pseudomonas fluorescens]
MCGAAPNDLTQATEIKCGSWLACDDGLSVDKVSADPPLSQASQLPHFDWVSFRRYWANSTFSPSGEVNILSPSCPTPGTSTSL